MLFWSKKPVESAAKRALGYVAVFLCAAAVCAFVQAHQAFRDPDSFYHLKMAMLMREHGVIREFPWLPFTTLADNYADHHFLYHLLLISFISVFDPLQGMIVASVIFAAAAITLFYALLRAHGVRWPAAYAFILGTSGAFLFRLNLAKTSALSLCVIFVALIAIRKEKPLALFFISWLYVLLYGGWPIMLVVVGASLVAKAVTDRLTERHPWHSWAHRWFWKRLIGGSRHAFRDFLAASETKCALAATAGLAAGVVVNPYFPTNLRFYWEQIVQIAVVGYRDKVGVGSEWYPYLPGNLVAETGGVFLLTMLALALLAFMLFWPSTVRKGGGSIGNRELSAIFTAWILALIFLFLTLRSKRHVEYLVPFATYAAALGMNALVTRMDFAGAKRKLAEILPNRRVAVPLFLSWFVAAFLYAGIKDVILVRRLYEGGQRFSTYAGASAFLAARAPEDAIVFHSDWDDFPMLFLRDDAHRYIAGLDPTFLYRKDPERYRLWSGITTGRIDNGVAAIVRDKFGARYVLIENDHQAMRKSFEADPGAARIYHDAEASVFLIL